jgi:hypothetical protein
MNNDGSNNIIDPSNNYFELENELETIFQEIFTNNIYNNVNTNINNYDMDMHNILLGGLLNNSFFSLLNDSFENIDPVNEVLTRSLYDANPNVNVASEEELQKLSQIKYKNALNKELHTECAITKEPFEDDSDIIQLPCNHCFFVEPIQKWLSESSCECPICRYKFHSIEKKTSDEINSPNENINVNELFNEMNGNLNNYYRIHNYYNNDDPTNQRYRIISYNLYNTPVNFPIQEEEDNSSQPSDTEID